jgi:hypothetical protein
MTIRNPAANKLSPAEIELRLEKGYRMLAAEKTGGDASAIAELLRVKSHDRRDFMTVAAMFGENNPSGFPMKYVKYQPWVVMQHLTRKYLPESYSRQLAWLILYWIERDWLGQPESPYSVPPNSGIVFDLTRPEFERFTGPIAILYAHMKQEKGEALSDEEQQAVEFEAPNMLSLLKSQLPAVVTSAAQEPEPPTELHVPTFSVEAIHDLVQSQVDQAIAAIQSAFDPGQGARTTIVALSTRIRELDESLRTHEQHDILIGGCLGVLGECLSDIKVAGDMQQEATTRALEVVGRMKEIIEATGTSNASGNDGRDTETHPNQDHPADAFTASSSDGGNTVERAEDSEPGNGGDAYTNGLDGRGGGKKDGATTGVDEEEEEAFIAAGK